MADTDGPYIVWENHGCEGWHPKSYADLAGALTSLRYVSDWQITLKAKFTVGHDGSVTVHFPPPDSLPSNME